MYRCEALTVEGFVQQVAVSYLANGYFFYVVGVVPGDKDPRAVDAKLLKRYGVDISKWSRARRKAAGLANMQYLRFGRFFVLLATHGRHRFFDEEKNQIRDARRTPIRFEGYAISYRGGHAHVRIEQERYKELKAYFLDLAVHRRANALEGRLWDLPFEPYAPVRRQLLNILRAVNRKRKEAGYSKLSSECLRLRRVPCRVFDRASIERQEKRGRSPARG